MNHRTWVALSGYMWLLMGAWLAYKGARLVASADSAQQAALYAALGMIIGLLKGRFVLSKTVRRVVLHIKTQPLPIRFRSAYRPSYWILIISMMALGISFRFLPIAPAIRGLIDIAIGSALISGALDYFRQARQLPLAHL